MRTEPALLSKRVHEKIRDDATLRSHVISIGIPILLPDGKHLLRGPEIKIPAFHGEGEAKILPGKVNLWAHDGWVDLLASVREAHQLGVKLLAGTDLLAVGPSIHWELELLVQATARPLGENRTVLSPEVGRYSPISFAVPK
jgi:hypothetical protein